MSAVAVRFPVVAEPGDTWELDGDSFAGTLARVVRVSADADIIHALFPNGNRVKLNVSEPTTVAIDDILLVGNEGRWEVVPADLWMEVRGVGVVRKKLENSLLVEGAGGLVHTEAAGSIEVNVGNTVLYSAREGAIELIDDEPIRFRDQTDLSDDAHRFEVAAVKGALQYSDFGGYPRVVERARHIIETQFNHKDRLDEIGARPVRGVLFSVAPGTGKTYLARVIAAESDASFFLVSGPAIVSKYVGDTEQLLRQIFAEAQARQRAIVFVDEIDSIAGERNQGSHEASTAWLLSS